jgi:hypothetical protein
MLETSRMVVFAADAKLLSLIITGVKVSNITKKYEADKWCPPILLFS